MNKTNPTNWFSASILWRGKKINTRYADLWEETICLFQAATEEEAEKMAEEKGRSAETSFQSIEGHTVEWTYDGILSIYCLSTENVDDGTEIFSRFLSEEQVKSLRTPIADE